MLYIEKLQEVARPLRVLFLAQGRTEFRKWLQGLGRLTENSDDKEQEREEEEKTTTKKKKQLTMVIHYSCAYFVL